MLSTKNTIADFRVSAKLSCALGDGLNNEQNRDHCWKFPSGPRLGAAGYVIFPTATPSDAPGLVYQEEVIRPTANPSDAPDLFYGEDAEEISAIATSAVSSSSHMPASDSVVSFAVEEHPRPLTEVFKFTHADHSPVLSNLGRATKSQDFMLAYYVTDFATHRLAGHSQPIKHTKEDSHAAGEQDSRSNNQREMMSSIAQVCRAENDKSSFHFLAQSKRRRSSGEHV
jgi:hypothetical protein